MLSHCCICLRGFGNPPGSGNLGSGKGILVYSCLLGGGREGSPPDSLPFPPFSFVCEVFSALVASPVTTAEHTDNFMQ